MIEGWDEDDIIWPLDWAAIIPWVIVSRLKSIDYSLAMFLSAL